MSLSALPLSYCTNVHPGRNLSEVLSGLRQFTVPMREVVGSPIAAGLWLAAPVISELLSETRRTPEFAGALAELGLPCYTLNAFPYGDFHSPRVKENVYLPDWSDPARLKYTQQCAQVLAMLLPEGAEGSISTVPLGFKGFSHAARFQDDCIGQLLTLARSLRTIHERTGRMVRLAIEPEPLCVLETTCETIDFFRRLFEVASHRGELELAQRHLGVCYDVCHQAVEFESIPESIAALDQAGVRLNKIHITCALQLDRPAENSEGRAALARYVEERYLHQTTARLQTGVVLRRLDLSSELALDPPREFREADCWRIHFHVPVDAESLGPLGTTRAELKQALSVVTKLHYAPHLEVETYTWEVLPGQTGERSVQDLVNGLAREMTSTRALLTGLQSC